MYHVADVHLVKTLVGARQKCNCTWRNNKLLGRVCVQPTVAVYHKVNEVSKWNNVNTVIVGDITKVTWSLHASRVTVVISTGEIQCCNYKSKPSPLVPMAGLWLLLCSTVNPALLNSGCVGRLNFNQSRPIQRYFCRSTVSNQWLSGLNSALLTYMSDLTSFNFLLPWTSCHSPHVLFSVLFTFTFYHTLFHLRWLFISSLQLFTDGHNVLLKSPQLINSVRVSEGEKVGREWAWENERRWSHCVPLSIMGIGLLD